MEFRTVFFIFLAIIITYAVLQTLYTGYFSVKSRTLVKTTYTGKKSLGEFKNPEFKILVDGDSVGAGVGASSFNTTVAGRVAEFYSKKQHVEFINNSVNGFRMADLVNKSIPGEKQNLTLLVISSNDLFHFTNLEQFRVSTQKVLDRYGKNTDKLILIGPGRVFDTAVLPFFIKPFYKIQGPKYANIISEEAKKYPNVIYVDPLKVSVSKNKYGDTNATDGFHPNDEGYRFWFDLIQPKL